MRIKHKIVHGPSGAKTQGEANLDMMAKFNEVSDQAKVAFIIGANATERPDEVQLATLLDTALDPLQVVAIAVKFAEGIAQTGQLGLPLLAILQSVSEILFQMAEETEACDNPSCVVHNGKPKPDEVN